MSPSTGPSEFAPLIISRQLRHEALWVLHNKIKLCADVSTLMLVNEKRASIPIPYKLTISTTCGALSPGLATLSWTF